MPDVIETVIFDIDGTLIDTWNLYVEAYLRTFQYYLGRRLTLEELIALKPTSEFRLLASIIAHQEPREVHGKFLDHYRQLHSTHFEGVYPGVHVMLEKLRKAAIPLGIVTGKSRPAWGITRRQIGLGNFAVVICDEDVKTAKPDPEGLILALQYLDISPRRAIYVGDSVGDASAAAAAGVKFAAALWPKALWEIEDFLVQVREIGCWVELKQPQELLPHVVD